MKIYLWYDKQFGRINISINLNVHFSPPPTALYLRQVSCKWTRRLTRCVASEKNNIAQHTIKTVWPYSLICMPQKYSFCQFFPQKSPNLEKYISILNYSMVWCESPGSCSNWIRTVPLHTTELEVYLKIRLLNLNGLS